MPQTGLALLAMMIASLFAIQMQRNIAHQQVRMIRNELAIQGTGVAEDILGIIGAKAFDQRLIDEKEAAAPSDLTPKEDFTDDAPSNDLDDYDGSPLALKNRVRKVGGTTIEFGARVSVSYADPADLETKVGGPTKAKKVTVRVWSLTVSAPDTVEISRSFTCGSKCTW